MRTLSRHFLGSYLTLYAAILFVSVLVIAVVEMMVNFDDIIEVSEGPMGVAVYLFLRLPTYYLPYLIPFASFGAAFLCLGLPARARELVAIKAGGIAPIRIALPVFAASILISALTLVANETVVRDASRAMNRLEGGGGDSDLFQSKGSFWYHKGLVLYNVREADRANHMLYGVDVFERDPDGTLVRRIQAESARIDAGGLWQLRDATIRHFDPGDRTAPARTLHIEETQVAVGSDRELALLEANAGNLSLPRLLDYIAAVTEDGRNASRYRALLHARMAEPFSVLLFTLLGVPLGLAVERSRSLAIAGVEGIAVLGLYYGSRTTTALVADAGLVAAVSGPWLLLALFSGYAAWRFRSVPT